MVIGQFALLKLRQKQLCSRRKVLLLCCWQSDGWRLDVSRSMEYDRFYFYIHLWSVYCLSLLHAELGDKKNTVSERYEFYWWILIPRDVAEVVSL
jgi:hypothetical protein